MYDVVIIGFGKAGQLHYQVLRQWQPSVVNPIYFFDPFFPENPTYEHLRINREELEKIFGNKNLILDVCSNTDNHIKWIDFACRKKIRKVIIEKPLVAEQDDLRFILSDIAATEMFVVNYNYLSSAVLKEILDIIN